MAGPARVPRVIRFGLFEADFSAGELRKNGLKVKLQDRPFEILSILLERPGELISREEFRQRLWPADTFVDFDHSLNASINKLRQALDDMAGNPRFVATVGRRGYSFIPPVEALNEEPAGTLVTNGESTGGTPAHKKSRISRLGIGALAAAVAAAALALFPRSSPAPRVKRIIQLTHEREVSLSELVTDGPRVYFGAGIPYHEILKQVTIAGGDSSTVRELLSTAHVEDIFAGSSELLVTTEKGSLWVVSLLGNFTHHLGPDEVSAAAWSPDGNRVVYAKGSDLYVVNRDGRDTKKLVTLPAEAACLRWSPDGSKIRFGLGDPKPQPLALWEVDSDGRGLRPVLSGWSAGKRPSCGNWTADGRYFVFEAVGEGTRDIWAIREESSRFDRRRSAPFQLTFGPLNFFSPTPSRDGTRLFVVGQQRRGELTRYEAQSKKFLPFLDGISADGVEFSHDGKWVAYTTYPERILWKSRPDGSERSELTSSPMRAFLPVWSPDDKWILFHAVERPNHPLKIYLTSPTGGPPEMLIGDEDSQEAGGSWSPDGKAIVYSYGKISSYPAVEGIDLRVLELKTKRTTTLPGTEGLYSPQWSPDGRYVAALVGNKDSLVLYDTTTQKWTTLLAQGIGYPSWSPDGRYIYCNTLWRKGPALVRLTVAGGKVESVPVDFKAAGTNGAWSGTTPDGSFLMLRDVGSQDVYSLEVVLP